MASLPGTAARGRGAAGAVALILLLVVPTAPSQPADLEVRSGPGVALVVHHPYPDDADPLGFPLDGVGTFQARHRHHDPDGDGFDFPTLVADGVVLIEGLPQGDDPEAATRAAYEAAIERRGAVEAAVVLDVFTDEFGEGRQAMVQATPRAALDADLSLWVALVEQPVHFEPPPALSNGIVDHPYTLRALADKGRLDLSEGAPAGASHRFAIEDDWREDRLFVAVWVQQGAGAGSRFAAHEVVQATMHPWAADHVTRQEQKGVLLEGYSATWCAPCLFGDRAFEAVAEAHGLPSAVDHGPRTLRYLDVPGHWPVLALAALAAAWAAGRRAWPGSAGGEDEP